MPLETREKELAKVTITQEMVDGFFRELGLPAAESPQFHALTESNPRSFRKVIADGFGGISAIVVWWEAGRSLIVSEFRSNRELTEDEVYSLLHDVTYHGKQFSMNMSYVESGVDECFLSSLRKRGFRSRTPCMYANA